MKRILLIFICSQLALFSCQTPSDPSVSALKVEYLENPIGIDRPHPIFSWELRSEKGSSSQSTYQVLVASEEKLLRQDTGDLWDSGPVNSSQRVNIRYAGAELASHQRCFWKVRVWDEAGKISAWSPIHYWQTGLLKAEDWKGKWISNRYAEVSRQRESFSQPKPEREFTSSDTAALYLRKEFTLSGKIERATAYVSGLGYYELYLNANKVGDRVLDPVFTDYQKTVKYAAYDLTEQLQNQSPHCIAAILGNGF